ncbi:RANBPM-like protein [Fusarium beomiforme]|uniref:RANBPM-like protein n=1 Tax=Fusarium beomiforme TaxID=44412 RepID=A0A9P5A5Y8_9HYPO|nr:RANBPM-like protein [Fusarium beomiforme]
MASPFHQASSSSVRPESPSARHAHFSPPHNSSIANIPNFYTHPSRTSIVSPSGEFYITGPEVTDSMETVGSETYARRTGLPSFSRAFNMLVESGAVDNKFKSEDDGSFFVPSYLENSTYVQKLQQAHQAKQSRDSRLPANGLLSQHSATGAFNQHPLPPGSHRGMSHTVIERPPAFEDDDDLAPLPTKWNKDDQWGGIEIQADGRTVKYVGPKSNQHDQDHMACAVRADHYMPPQCGIYYFEVQIATAKRDDATIGIGFATKTVNLSRPVGWEPEAWGYHGDDGRCFTGSNIGRHFGPGYNANDVIGCGVNFKENNVFFTKNGVKLGTAFNDINRGKLYPAISLKKPGESIRVNFGQTPFVYNIDDLMREERERVQRDIQNTDTSTLVPNMSENDVIQALVLQFLQHDGYVGTARAFAEDIKKQKEALRLHTGTKVDVINIKDDEDANNRQRIRQAILEGDIDRALKFTNAYYPHVLKDNEHVYFRLQCRKFIELVRKAAQLNMRHETKGNGHVNSTAPQTMDLDLTGSETASWDADGDDHTTVLAELERSMLEYGQTLQEQYANDPRVEVSKALNEIWALVAYQNPLKEPEVSHLLDRNGRVAVAEELNSAILLSLGKSSTAALEKVYAQTCVLLEDLRQDGGEGAFASVSDVLKEISQPPQN